MKPLTSLLTLEDLDDAPIYQITHMRFNPGWQEYDRPLSPSERAFLRTLRAFDGTPSYSEPIGTPPFQSTENDPT
jgi:hypothetical protein